MGHARVCRFWPRIYGKRHLERSARTSRWDFESTSGGRLMIFSSDEDFARQLDREDPLRDFRERFSLPLGKGGTPVIYFAGNSLGLMPKSAKQIVDDELGNWARLGVDAHLATGTPWYSYHEALRDPAAQLVGA